MENKKANNPYQQDWEKELSGKNMDELIGIVANEEAYAPAFVEMAWMKLKSCDGYDEEAVAKKMEALKESPTVETAKSVNPKTFGTSTMGTIQDWGWFVGISGFLILVAIMSISQAIEKFSYWEYLDAGWWFVVFYGVCCALLYWVAGKIKKTRNAKKQKHHVGAATGSMGGPEQMMGTRELFLETLTKIGCQYEVYEEGRIAFAWQGGHFVADAADDCLFVVVWYTFWAECELYDIDAISRMKRVINEANIAHNLNVVYSANEAGSTFHVHSKKHFLFVPQVSDTEGYLQAILSQFFTVRRYVEAELDKLKNKEERTGK